MSTKVTNAELNEELNKKLDIIEKNESTLCEDFCYTNTFVKCFLIGFLIGFILLVFFVVTHP